MRKNAPIFLTLTVILAFALSFVLRDGGAENKEVEPAKCDRLVSLSPSLTEVIYALELQDRLYGVTRFCSYPKEATQKAKVGGYVDPNYEAIATLKPDLVLLIKSHDTAKEKLSLLGIPSMGFDNDSVDGVMESIKEIGEVCGVSKKAKSLVDHLNNRIESVKQKVRDRQSPKVLVSIGRKMGTGTFRDSYVAAPETYYDDLVAMAGGQNAFVQKGASYPIVTGEGILRLNPDVIIDIVADPNSKVDKKQLKQEWFSVLRMNKENVLTEDRIHIVQKNFAAIPGPRFILLLESFARMIHPELQWD